MLNDSSPNAWALPGGKIAINRGLLTEMSSEAELAAVLGHEIGHVTARHSVRQHSAQTTATVVGAVVSVATGIQGVDDLTNMAGTAIVRGYGREHELEADRHAWIQVTRGRLAVNGTTLEAGDGARAFEAMREAGAKVV